MFFGIIYDKILVFIDIMYCKVYRIYIRFGKRIEIFYLLLKSNGDKVNFCLYCMFCDVCKNIRIVKLFIVY